MTPSTLKRAIAEAERFLRIARKVPLRTEYVLADSDTYFASKESAAAKRASMDLTRALAELRSRR